MAESEIKMDLLIYIEGMRDSFGTDGGMQDAIWTAKNHKSW